MPGDPDEQDTTIYTAVVNDEQQYSIWPVHKEIPLGWTAVGEPGPKDQVLEYVERVWTDMRPLSLRKAMEEDAQTQSRPEGMAE